MSTEEIIFELQKGKTDCCELFQQCMFYHTNQLRKDVLNLQQSPIVLTLLRSYFSTRTSNMLREKEQINKVR